MLIPNKRVAYWNRKCIQTPDPKHHNLNLLGPTQCHVGWMEVEFQKAFTHNRYEVGWQLFVNYHVYKKVANTNVTTVSLVQIMNNKIPRLLIIVYKKGSKIQT